MAPVHDEDSATGPPREGAVDGVVLAALELDNLRDALLDAAMTWPSRVATALAFLVAAVDEAAVGDSCPQPAGGAGEREAAEWAGLWYGGRDDCFPLRGAKDTAAIRKRRSRAVAELQEVLVAAAERTELEEDRHA
jgi:hypothetical protein